MIERLYPLGDFTGERVGQSNHLVCYLKTPQYTNSALPMTGADVTVTLEIPFFHRINRVLFLHLTSAFAKSYDQLHATVELKQGASKISPKLLETLISIQSCTSAEVQELYRDGWEFEPRSWSITLNSTSTDLIIPAISIQNLGGNS